MLGRRADSATRDAAAAAGLGVGRYQAAQELMSLDPSYTLEECVSMTMRQLRDRIDAWPQRPGGRFLRGPRTWPGGW